MGASRQRVLADFGGAYARRLFHARDTAFQYLVEVRPVTFESDRVLYFTNIYTYTPVGTTTPITLTQTGSSVLVGTCKAATGTFVVPPVPGLPPESIVYTNTCGRRWTFAQEFSPIGFKYSLRTSHALQPFLVGTGGYMYSNRPIPITNAGSFNFQFDFGAGIEIFRSKTRSVSVEARFHHFSNKETANANPGVDNINYKVSYNFGR